MEGVVRAKVEFSNGVVIEEGDNVKIVVSGTGAVVEGMAVKVARKNMEVEVEENFICKVAYDDMDDVTKQ